MELGLWQCHRCCQRAAATSFAAGKALGEFPGDSCSLEKSCPCLFPFLSKSGLSFQSEEVTSNVMEREEGRRWSKARGGVDTQQLCVGAQPGSQHCRYREINFQILERPIL